MINIPRGENMTVHHIGVLASGRGSNLQAIIEACNSGYINGRVTAVISDNPKAYALERASNANIPTVCINPSDYNNKEDCEWAQVNYLKEYGVDVICLAGYMRIVGKIMLREFHNKILNIHPSLLPSFPGLHAQQQALLHGVRFSGCTVHFVDAGVDTGPIILQAVVPVEHDDTVDSLSRRILEQEHIIYPQAIKLFLEGRLNIQGRKVRII